MLNVTTKLAETFECKFEWRSEDHHTTVTGKFWANEDSEFKVRFRIDGIRVFGLHIDFPGGPESYMTTNFSGRASVENVNEATLLDLIGTMCGGVYPLKADYGYVCWY